LPPEGKLLRGYRFGDFELDLKSGELLRADRKVKLQEQPFILLRLLVEHRGDVLTKEELRKAVWPANTFVDFDHGLHSAIARVRDALDDATDKPRFIETLPRRGYRFVAPVEEIFAPPEASPEQTPLPLLPERDETRPGARWLVTGVGWAALAFQAIAVVLLGQRLRRPDREPIKSLAVLPLLNLSGDPGKEYLADGITDELITDLAQSLNLRVISRTSAMRYKSSTLPATQIGRELNVDALIEGSFALTGRQVRITAQLIDARTDRHLWAHSYEQSLDDVLAVQSEMSHEIANEVSARLSPSAKVRRNYRKTVPQAHQSYMKARFLLNCGDESSLRGAIDNFHQALNSDPQDAQSYAGVSECFIGLDDFFAPPSEVMPEAKMAAQQALTLDDSLAEAHTVLGVVRFLYEWDWSGGETELRRGVELAPSSPDAHSWYALFLAHMGRNPDALREIERAEEIDPFSAIVRVNSGWIHYLGRVTIARSRNGVRLYNWSRISHYRTALSGSRI